MKKSALSAALAGGPAPAVPAPPTAPASKRSTTLDPVAFPCIEYAGVIDGTISEDQLGALEGQLQNLELQTVSIVGSAPTNVLLDGVPLVSSNAGMVVIHVERLARANPRKPQSSVDISTGRLPAQPKEKEGWRRDDTRCRCLAGTSAMSQPVPATASCHHVPVCPTSQGTSGSVPPLVGSLSSNYLSKAVIGSLPKGLTQEDKMKILQALPMSPSRALLQELGAVGILTSSKLGRSWRWSRSSSNSGQAHGPGAH